MFINAKPVFSAELWKKMNSFVIAKTHLNINEATEIHIAAADFYRLSINGEFVSFGPARTARGYAREDIIPLGEYACKNAEISIEVAAYYCQSLTTVRQDGFLLAEIFENGKSIAYTGKDFEFYISKRKIQMVDRYSMQRHFSEVWDFSRSDIKCDDITVLENAPKIIDRKAPYPVSYDVMLKGAATFGNLIYNPELPVKKLSYSSGGGLSDPDNLKIWGYFDYDEIPYHPFAYIQGFDLEKNANDVDLPISLSKEQFAIFDFSRIETGFLKISAEANEKTNIVIAFSEACEKDKFSFVKNMQAMNAMEIILEKGQKIDFQSFEPYVMRYCIVTVREGSANIKNFGIKTFERTTKGVYIPENLPEALSKIYNAAIRSFAHNAVDLYSDCPSRERAGWLCDSYFIAKTEQLLFGKTPVEDAFLENYRLFENQGEVPEGMVHMCYPSDVEPSGQFIPQWSMWYILQVEEYLNIRNKNADKELFKKSIFGLLGYYEKFENSDGLLEKMESWNFVEWSRANKWTQDINYPTNFLYSAVLEAAYKLYGDEKHLQKAQKIRAKTIEKSYRDGLFYDHSIYDENGVAVLQSDCSEVCQYYAIRFGGVDINAPEYSGLKDKVLNFFAPDRTEMLEEIERINAFMGIYLRIEILLNMKRYDLLEKELLYFFGPMEEATGTLWENRHKTGSLDHGFASYATVVIDALMKNK